MVDPGYTQKRMDEIQRDESFASAFSQIVSGRPGYKAVIEKKEIVLICAGCKRQLENAPKFCPDCGTKVLIKPTKCPKCAKGVFPNDKFCPDCGENLDPR